MSAILTDQQFIGLAPHLVLGQYTTHLIENLGGADCIKVATANLKDPTNATTSDQFKAEFKANKASLWSAWTGLGRSPYSLSSLTFPPSPSTDVPQQNAFLKDVTDTLRAGIIMVDSQRNPLLDANNNPIKARVIDVASIVGLASGSDWICADYSADTQHESQVGCLAISESGIIDPYALTR
ncbi:hypothetical protein [Bradyrhizobium ganzhouense]|uniref:hypothetical protein n=1 Tax=Bradyrhizobium ganzhouense TaxID=1179767 RepID=UPI003CF16256